MDYIQPHAHFKVIFLKSNFQVDARIEMEEREGKGEG